MNLLLNRSVLAVFQDPNAEAPLVHSPAEAPPPTPGVGTPTDPTGTQGPPAGVNEQCMQQLLMFGALALVFYFLLLRPQQKQEKQRREMISALKAGDHVVTSGGLHGTIAKLDSDTVTLTVDKVRMVFDRANVARVTSRDDAAASA